MATPGFCALHFPWTVPNEHFYDRKTQLVFIKPPHASYDLSCCKAYVHKILCIAPLKRSGPPLRRAESLAVTFTTQLENIKKVMAADVSNWWISVHASPEMVILVRRGNLEESHIGSHHFATVSGERQSQLESP